MDEVRNRLLSEGIRLFREHGYHGTGIQSITSAADIPKGSFNFYFASKEAFALAVIERYASRIVDGMQAYRSRDDRQPLAQLRAYFDDLLASMDEGEAGCAVGNLLAELGETNEALQVGLAAAWDRIASGLEAFLLDAQKKGDLGAEVDSRGNASLLLSGWEGALIAMRAQRSTLPLTQFLDLVFEPLLADRSES